MYKLYTTRYVNAISLICTFIIFILICFTNKVIKMSNFNFFDILGNRGIIKVQFSDSTTYQNEAEDKELMQNTTKDINSTKDENSTKDTNTENNETQEDAEIVTKEWYLEIPRIFLEAEIAEGTSKEVMDVAIGHFEESSKTAGNVCLAAHNRGYPVNYFQNLKLLKKGDTIYYRYKEFTKEYVVTENNIIEDTDWTYLEETEENTLTLITCIENEPEYRRCVRAIEK